MNSLFEYDFSSYSFIVPNIIKNLSSDSNSYLYNATMVNNPAINSVGINSQSSSVVFNSLLKQYISIPSFGTKNNGLTFSFWFKSNNNKDWARIFDFGNDSGSSNIFVSINGGNMGFSVFVDGKMYQNNNVIPNINRCTAKLTNGEQCTRTRRQDSEFCGTHHKFTPHGKISEEKETNTDKTLEIMVVDIQGIIYYMDKFNNVYNITDILEKKENPQIVGKYKKNGTEYKITYL